MKKVILFKSDFSRHFLSNYFVSLIAVSLLLLSGCGSDKADNSADLSLKIPQYQSISNGIQSNASVGQLSHIFISITGPNIAVPISYEWSQCKECTTQLPAPTSFKLGVPTGDSRLIQVLVVYEDQATDSTGLFYGDTTQSLVSGDNAVGVTVSAILKTTNLVEGRIAGRYIDRIDNVTVAAVTTPVAFGPTSEVLIKYKPLNKPAMTIDRSSIVNGWFNFFALKDVNFNYELPNGTVLFNNVNLDSFKPQAAGSVPGRYAHVWFPQHFRKYDAASPGEKEREKINVVGWFGSAALPADFKVCASSTAPQIDYLYSMDSSSNITVNKLYLTSFAALTPPTLATAAVYGADTSCTGFTSQLLSIVQFLAPELFNQGNDSVGGFRGLFSQFRDAANTHFTYSEFQNTAPTTLKFKLLPGVPLVTTSIEHWQTSLTPSQGFHFDNVPCRAIRSGLITGFTKLSTTPTTVGQLDFSVPFRAEDQNALNVFCPVFNNFTLDTGFVMYPQSGSSALSMNITAAPSNYLSLSPLMNVPASQKSVLTNSTCQEILLDLNNTSQPGISFPSSITVTNFHSGTNFAATGCTGVQTTVSDGGNITFSQLSGSTYRAFFKPNISSKTFTKTVSLNPTQFNLSTYPQMMWDVVVEQPYVSHLFSGDPNLKFSTSFCYVTPLALGYASFGQQMIPISNGEPATSTLTLIQMFGSGSCSAAQTSLTLNSTPATGYFKPVAPTLNYTISDPSSSTSNVRGFNIQLTSDNTTGTPFVYLSLPVDQSFNACRAVDVVSVNSSMTVLPSLSVSVATLAAQNPIDSSSVSLYSSLTDCITNVSGSSVPISLSDAKFKKRLYFKKTASLNSIMFSTSSNQIKLSPALTPTYTTTFGL